MVVSASQGKLPRPALKELFHHVVASVSASRLGGDAETRLATNSGEKLGEPWRLRTRRYDGDRTPNHQRLSQISHRQSKRPTGCGPQAAKQTQSSDTIDGMTVGTVRFCLDSEERHSMDQ